MRVPIRKGGQYTNLAHDPYITEEKFNELNKKLAGLKKAKPGAAAEVSRLAEMGDFSENAAYQMAKGRLRSINRRIMEIEDRLKEAFVIRPNQDTDIIGLGNTVTMRYKDKEVIFKILGASETDPSRGIISQNSPLGSALMGRRRGDKIKVRDIEYEIINIE